MLVGGGSSVEFGIMSNVVVAASVQLIKVA